MNATLNARPRTESGKGAARKLRAAGRVPVVMYGHGDQTQSLSVDALELEKLLAHISVENTLLELAVEGGGTTRALIREVQMHPFKPEVLHLDLLQVHAGEKIRLHVPVRLVGSAEGVRSGGVMDQVLYDLDVECLPRDIPEVLEVDVSALQVGDSARVRDVRAPDGVVILNDAELPIASVLPPTVPVLEVAPEMETGLQPELVRDRSREAEEPDQA